MAQPFQEVKITNKAFGKYSGVKVKVSDALYGELKKTKTQQGDMVTMLEKGRALRGLKHLIETIKSKSMDNQIIFTHDSTRKSGNNFR